MDGQISQRGRVTISKQEQELMQLTLQLRKKENEAKYAKFHGDALIGNLPPVVKSVLEPTPGRDGPKPSSDVLNNYIKGVEGNLKEYLNKLMADMVMRESISMTSSTFQIDATRDFAIPVVTKYVADFLGFGDKLRQLPTQDKNTYSENEIYQHITNCQIFLTYDTDETKWMQRRQAFKTSMEELVKLTQNGTIWEAGSWNITRALFGKRDTNAMHELGVFVAKEVLEYEKNQSKAAAILLLICLDIAYSSVVSFTATLDGYMKELYAAADGKHDKEPRWIALQRCVFSTSENAQTELERKIQLMAQETVRLPILRKAENQIDSLELPSLPGDDGAKVNVKIKKGDTIVLDLSKALEHAEQTIHSEVHSRDKVEFLTSQLSIADKYGVFSPRRFATISLTAMIKFIAQMKDPRRGHDTQGKLKKIHLDSTPEGYANYMAPDRVRWIKEQVKSLKQKKAEEIFTDGILKPENITYLTPTWDEFVPFPMTWKIRFDGFGPSDYAADGNPYGRVKTSSVHPDHCPPWYQPQGPSATGGSFATVVCVCAEGDGTCPCAGHSNKGANVAHQPVPVSTGCGLSD
ncbi:hypothetical protein FGRMN_7048 [Fusarium graminum]|nr:hypothetical protein FGRMN_7048 [Fusarium graminum]